MSFDLSLGPTLHMTANHPGDLTTTQTAKGSNSATITWHAMSIDLEDWFQYLGVPSLEDPQTWDARPSLVQQETEKILLDLAAAGTTATFFVLGWIARKYPTLVRQIANEGHEIACHGHWHRRVYTLDSRSFSEELTLALSAIEDITGRAVRGFRAPSFSIIPGAEWAFDVLLDHGITYDASLFPAIRDDGGYPCPTKPFSMISPSGRSIAELPMSTMKVGSARIAFSGGGYLRLAPLWMIRRGFAQFENRGDPVVVYIHPRDFAVDCPRVPMPPLKRFKSYYGLGSTRSKFRALLDQYHFTTCQDVLFGCGLLRRNGHP